MKDIKLARLLVLFEAETKGFKRDLAESERSFGRTASFIKANAGAAAGAIAALLAGIAIKAAEAASKFDGSMRKIAASIPRGTDRVGDLGHAVGVLQRETGRSSDEIVTSLQAIARTGVSSFDELITRFRGLSRVQDATQADFGLLTEGLDQVLDLFGLTGDQIEVVGAKLAAIGREGGFPIEDILAAFQAAAPSLASAGVSFDDAAGALGRFVAKGYNAKQAGAALKELFSAEGAAGIHSWGGAIRDTTQDLADLARQGEVVRQSQERLAGQIAGIWEETQRKIEQGIKERTLDQLQGVAILLTHFKALKAFSFAGGGGAGAAAAVLSLVQDQSGIIDATRSPGRGVHAAGTAPVGHIRTPQEQDEANAALERLRNIAVRTFTTTLPSTIDATAQAIQGLSIKLIALGTPSEDLAAKLQPLLDRLRELGDRALAVQIEDAVSRGPEQAIDRLLEIRQSLVETLGIDQSGDAAQATLQKIANVDVQIEKANRQLVDDHQAQADASAEVLDNSEEILATSSKTHHSLKEIVGDLTDVAKGALGFAEAFGLVNDSTAAALNNILNIADALPSALEGDVSSIVNVLGNVGGLLGSLFGESADAKRDRVLREQTLDAMRDLAKALNDQVSGNTVQGPRDAIAAILGSGRNLGKGITGGQPGLNTAAVNSILKPFGLTLQELQDQLKLIDPRLQLNTSSAIDFVNSLKLVQKALDSVQFVAFADSFAGKLSFLQVQLDLLDLTNPIDQLKALQQLASNESPIVKQLLGSLDLTTAQGRAEAEKQLLALLGKLNTKGALTGTDLGNLSEADLLDLIKQIEGLLDQVKGGGTSGGSTTNFTSENRITETTGARLAGLAESQLAVQKEILAALTGNFLPITAPILPFTGPLENAVTLTVGDITVQFMGPVGDTALAASAVASVTADQVDRLLGQVIQKRLAQLGKL